MLEHVWIAECDLCGATANLPKGAYTRYFPDGYTMPEGWGYGANKNCQFCPKCLQSRFPHPVVVPAPDPEIQEALYG